MLAAVGMRTACKAAAAMSRAPVEAAVAGEASSAADAEGEREILSETRQCGWLWWVYASTYRRGRRAIQRSRTPWRAYAAGAAATTTTNETAAATTTEADDEHGRGRRDKASRRGARGYGTPDYVSMPSHQSPTFFSSDLAR